jgi:catechol 2,3-dioxygenase-like lactoylglutathione lyase family enzyme
MSATDRSPLGAPVQIAYGVTGLAAAAARFSASTGAGPFVVVEHIELRSARVRGIHDEFDHSSAYGQWGPVMVELVEEHTTPLVAPGSGVHHMAFMVPSLDDAAAWCDQQGWPELLRAETSGGQLFAFHDARQQLGHLVELYEPSERLIGFYRSVAAAADGWDGSEPVRRPG